MHAAVLTAPRLYVDAALRFYLALTALAATQGADQAPDNS